PLWVKDFSRAMPSFSATRIDARFCLLMTKIRRANRNVSKPYCMIAVAASVAKPWPQYSGGKRQPIPTSGGNSSEKPQKPFSISSAMDDGPENPATDLGHLDPLVDEMLDALVRPRLGGQVL